MKSLERRGSFGRTLELRTIDDSRTQKGQAAITFVFVHENKHLIASLLLIDRRCLLLRGSWRVAWPNGEAQNLHEFLM